jgi:hypothetical protein
VIADTQDRLAERRQRWQALSPEQQRRRIQAALLDVIEIARWRRMRRQQRTNDFLFPQKERRRDHLQSK